MAELTIYRRRRDGGDVPGVVRRRRRDGGDLLLRRREVTTPVTPAATDVVEEFLKQRPFYIAHRMGGTEYPEFTQRGLDASLRAGFKALEISVRLCARGQNGEPAEFIAIHDWKTTRTVPGTDLPIWSTPWSTLRTLQQGTGPFMRLRDIVDQIPDDVVLAIDHRHGVECERRRVESHQCDRAPDDRAYHHERRASEDGARQGRVWPHGVVPFPRASVADADKEAPTTQCSGGGGLPLLSGLGGGCHSDSGIEIPVVAGAVAVREPVVEL